MGAGAICSNGGEQASIHRAARYNGHRLLPLMKGSQQNSGGGLINPVQGGEAETRLFHFRQDAASVLHLQSTSRGVCQGVVCRDVLGLIQPCYGIS